MDAKFFGTWEKRFGTYLPKVTVAYAFGGGQTNDHEAISVRLRFRQRLACYYHYYGTTRADIVINCFAGSSPRRNPSAHRTIHTLAPMGLTVRNRLKATEEKGKLDGNKICELLDVFVCRSILLFRDNQLQIMGFKKLNVNI